MKAYIATYIHQTDMNGNRWKFITADTYDEIMKEIDTLKTYRRISNITLHKIAQIENHLGNIDDIDDAMD